MKPKSYTLYEIVNNSLVKVMQTTNTQIIKDFLGITYFNFKNHGIKDYKKAIHTQGKYTVINL
jgi:hypothetical protein